ncbi:MAG: S-methyl-5-thioribose-1-phosphate isomerase [Peptococcaceae bacterium]|nr:MAG: S-methyl-5-thioribose-1-phosphate isomerase [Peptococcaceae bacterium]
METMRWNDEGFLELLDQTRLPGEVCYVACRDYQDVAEAIKTMQVRGAPAIGAAAAYGMALGALNSEVCSKEDFISRIGRIGRELVSTRPTAVNLQWAVERVIKEISTVKFDEIAGYKKKALEIAHAIYREDIAGNRSIGRHGQELVPAEARVLTHCNAGALATAGYGTALGVVRAASEAGKKVSVYADETRPLLQGARLTAWEMVQENIPVTLITDSMAGYLMAKGMVDLVIVGADRIAANGDVANKIGTYGLAVLAGEHGVPFYVAAPFSTVDLNLATGADIPIEERNRNEVTSLAGRAIAPAGVNVWNPAFDVTPNHLITAIITDRGVLRQPYRESLRQAK